LKIEVAAGIPDTKKITAEFENLSIEEAVNRLSTIILMSWIQQREKERSSK
jgi:hypothetical protein